MSSDEKICCQDHECLELIKLGIIEKKDYRKKVMSRLIFAFPPNMKFTNI